ncbi:MAG: ATP-binding protein [Acetatifactor sp.]|nr:ATP-binding protein [Acetatifactor sp.]
MKYITRNLENVVNQVTKEYPVILVTGPRQVGKTTMLQKLMEGTDRGYVTLDDLSERNIAKTDPELFLQLHKPPILIDEVQYAPELFSYIKMNVDKNHEPGAFWLTGSQVFKLMQGVQESLAGRVAVLSLTSLSQAEISGCQTEPFTVDLEALSTRKEGREEADARSIFERIYRGSMPAVVSGANSNSKIFYSSYLSTYIERDVRQLSDTIDSLKFLRFITAAAARCGQMLNIAEIARDADINQVQAKSWLGILETLGIIFYLHPYSNNLLKRLVKTPKLYFYDTGLICYLTKWSSAETLESGAMNGTILENYVVAEIMKTYLNSGREPYLYYYRDKDAKEIDVILEHDGVLNPIEIKKTSNPGTELTKVFALLDKASTPRSRGAVICMKPELGAIDRDNYIVPVWMI